MIKLLKIVVFSLISVCLIDSSFCQGVQKPTKRFQLSSKIPSYEVPVWTGVAVDSSLRAYVGGDDHKIRCWNLQTGKLESKLTRNVDWVKAVRLRPDGLVLLSADMSETGILWETDTRQKFMPLRGITSAVNCGQFSPDGNELALGLFGGQVLTFNSVTGRPLQNLSLGNGDVYTMAYSPDGRYIAAAGRTGIIRVWDTKTEGSFKDLTGHVRRVATLDFTPEGKLLSGSEGNRVNLWDVETGQQIAQIEELSGKVRKVVSLGGYKVAVAMTDNNLEIWDIQKQAKLKQLEGHSGTVHDMQFVPGPNWLVTVGFDCSLCVWALGN